MYQFDLKSCPWWIFMGNIFIQQCGVHEEDSRAGGGNREDVNS